MEHWTIIKLQVIILVHFLLTSKVELAAQGMLGNLPSFHEMSSKQQVKWHTSEGSVLSGTHSTFLHFVGHDVGRQSLGNQLQPIRYPQINPLLSTRNWRLGDRFSLPTSQFSLRQPCPSPGPSSPCNTHHNLSPMNLLRLLHVS